MDHTARTIPPPAGPDQSPREPAHSGAGAGDGALVTTAARVRELVTEASPAWGFTLTYVPSQRVDVAAGVALALGVMVAAHRVLRRRPPWRIVAALCLAGAGAALAARSGDATDYFVPQVVVHVSVVVISGVLLLVGYPTAGLFMGFVTGEGLRWRACGTRRRAYSAASLVLLASSTTTTSAIVVLFLAHNTVGLGILDMCNPFVFAVAVVGAWRSYRYVLKAHDCAGLCP